MTSTTTPVRVPAPKPYWVIETVLPVRYEILEVDNLLDPRNPELRQFCDGGDEQTVVVIDQSIESLYGESIRAYFSAHGVSCSFLSIQSAEEVKSLELVERVASALNSAGTRRAGNPPIAIGGGVMLDVVGLAASLFRRGIPYVRVPTTLLGQVDVSVAAKTGVNFEGYRNRLGSYGPPPRTLIDRAFLATLPERHIRNGLGEIFKMALIKDVELFELLENFGPDLVETKFAHAAGHDVIGRAIKGMVDELAPNLWEKELQRAVDYGHSFSPLVEMRALPDLLHGEAVTLDCLFSAVLSWQRGLLSRESVLRAMRVAHALGLPVTHPLFLDVNLLVEALADTQRHRDGNQNLPVMTEIGRYAFLNDVTRDELAAASGLTWELGLHVTEWSAS